MPGRLRDRLAEHVEPDVGVDPPGPGLRLHHRLGERQARGVRGQVAHRGALGSRRHVPVDRALLDRDEHGVGGERLRHRGEPEDAILLARCGGDLAVGRDDRRRRVPHGPVEHGADGRVHGRAAPVTRSSSSGRWWDPRAGGAHLGRDIGLAVPAVARHVLPAGAGPAAGAGTPVAVRVQHRDQRLVLLAAAAGVLPGLGGADARRLPFRGQGRPVRHPPQAAARRPGPARELPRLGGARAGREARAAAVAAAAAPALRPRPARAVPRAAAPHDRCGGARWPSSTTSASTAARTPQRTPTGRCGTRWRSATPASATPAFVELLREHDVALVVADSAGTWPVLRGADGRLRLRPAARRDGALHERLHPRGVGRLGREGAGVARRRSPPSTGRAARDVFVYFDNDAKVHAPFDAIALAGGSVEAGLRGTELVQPGVATREGSGRVDEETEALLAEQVAELAIIGADGRGRGVPHRRDGRERAGGGRAGRARGSAGSLVAYASEVKYDVLGVPHGPVVSAEAASAMARGVRRLLRADVALGVTGAGGPAPGRSRSGNGLPRRRRHGGPPRAAASARGRPDGGVRAAARRWPTCWSRS